jgi:hypothetical protein
VHIIERTLLNSPFQDFGVNEGDKVRFFPYKSNNDGKFILICNLDSKK